MKKAKETAAEINRRMKQAALDMAVEKANSGDVHAMDELMTIWLEISVNAKDKEDKGPEALGMCLGCGADDGPSTAEYLRRLADAIECGTTYGFLATERALLPLSCGEWEPVNDEIGVG